jgi:arylsulfatase A-like enzyme
MARHPLDRRLSSDAGPSLVGLSLALLLAGCGRPLTLRPDIVFILADDLGYADVGFTGGKDVRTPHIDGLAAEGVVLRQFYVQASCSPTRAALMTGRYPMRYGLQSGIIRPWADYGLPLDERLLPEALRDAGYTTALVGKWHLGSFERAYWPTSRGFDHHYGPLLGAIDYFSHMRDGKLDWYRDGQPLQEEGYSTKLMAAEAVRTIAAQPKDRPLFLEVAFNAVHSPHQVPERYLADFAGLSEPRRTYVAMVAALDEAVGEIVAATEAAGRRGNTLFVFSGDNGGPDLSLGAAPAPFRGAKGTLYEGGVRTCVLVNWRGHLGPPRIVDEPLHVVDWYPTLTGLAGAASSGRHPLDGEDAWPAIAEGAKSPHEEILLNSAPHTGAIRVGDWKLVLNGHLTDLQNAADERYELFHLRDDPEERHDLSVSNPRQAAELKARYLALASQAAPARNSERPSPP